MHGWSWCTSRNRLPSIDIKVVAIGRSLIVIACIWTQTNINAIYDKLFCTNLNIITTDNEPILTFTPTRAEVLRPGETLQLNLSLNQLTGRMADLYLRLNLPSESPEKQRVSFFKIWNSHDGIEKIAYNFPLASPYLLTNDLFLPLYGTRALLGPGLIDSAMLEGVYELSARLTFADNSIVQARKLIWVTDARLFQISGNE